MDCRSAKGEITIVTLLRATGHDFTQIGTGRPNDPNLSQNVIRVIPENALAAFYTDAETATSSRHGNVKKEEYSVSTDSKMVSCW